MLDKAVQEGAFRKLAYDATKPCYCTWDLGAPLNTINLVFQLDGPFINVLELDSGLHASERVAERVTRLKSKYPTLQANFLPHDGGYMTDTGMTQAQMWQEAGLPGIQLLPKSKDKWIGINYLCNLFWGGRGKRNKGREEEEDIRKEEKRVPGYVEVEEKENLLRGKP